MPEPKRDRPLAAVILAAGEGKRMGAPVPKVLVESCGWTLVEHVLEAVSPLEVHPTVIVYGHGGDAVRSALAGRDLQFVEQPEQLGTGDAVRCALPALGIFDGDVLILCGDTPLLSTEVLRGLVGNHRAAGRALTVLSANLEDAGSLGRIVRNAAGELLAIREAADASPHELEIREINTGVIVADARILGEALEAIRPDNMQGELYLTDVPEILLGRPDGAPVGVVRAQDPGAALGVNRPSDLVRATAHLRQRILARLADAGVRIEDPMSTVIDAGVEIGAGTVLRPFTWVAKGARIGQNCQIGPHVAIGPGSSVGDDVRIGAHTELRGVTVESKARILGSARLVGAVIGSGAWLSPGVVTEGSADGRIVIGENAHIGAGAVLVAPLTVGADARVGKGVVVNRDVSAPAATENSNDVQRDEDFLG